MASRGFSFGWDQRPLSAEAFQVGGGGVDKGRFVLEGLGDARDLVVRLGVPLLLPPGLRPRDPQGNSPTHYSSMGAAPGSPRSRPPPRSYGEPSGGPSGRGRRAGPPRPPPGRRRGRGLSRGRRYALGADGGPRPPRRTADLRKPP